MNLETEQTLRDEIVKLQAMIEEISGEQKTILEAILKMQRDIHLGFSLPGLRPRKLSPQ